MFNDIVDAMREGFGTCLKEIKYLSERVEAVEKKVGITTKRKGKSSQNTTSPPKPTLEPGVVLPNKNLTSLERPGAISFNISQEDFLGEHGSHGPIAAPRKRSAPTRHDEPAAEASEPIYGPPHYYFKPYAGVLPPGALRDAHEHIGRLQRWNKAQDKTIEKLKEKWKTLSKTVKKQAKTTAKFMKKVADVLTRGGIAGCSSADFAFANTSVPQPPPQPADLDFPLTAR
ncbi:hypothetical protein F2Q68_00005231 [Brassica cretica]|uniref:Arabidopsis retrotransposon Orf1 C-terminal domain-containing protein n=1 Tax=Brassica cretica TaxID=69181 RepID=A0A8S9J9B9_BRACR|nr:hypothetical protein F2Q68_00005231 [Brassica cretica]